METLELLDRGGVIMQGTELVVKATMCFAKAGVNISTTNPYLASVGMSVLVWPKHDYFNFF